jgi:hypothetical protein
MQELRVDAAGLQAMATRWARTAGQKSERSFANVKLAAHSTPSVKLAAHSPEGTLAPHEKAPGAPGAFRTND